MKTGTDGAKMYFIAVVLPPHLDEKIQAWKQWMKENYGSKVGLKSAAHITIAPPFWTDEENEILLRQDMELLAQTINQFQIATDNFSAFKPRTIFVAVEKNNELNGLKKASDDFFRKTAYGIKIENRPFHPHITIATRDLHKKAFADAWPHFQNREFREVFEATGLSLLKHNGRTWDVAFTAAFRKKES
jgi:2'-5' RNA ligase